MIHIFRKGPDQWRVMRNTTEILSKSSGAQRLGIENPRPFSMNSWQSLLLTTRFPALANHLARPARPIVSFDSPP